MAGQLLRPIAGDGVLARYGELVMLCAAADPRHTSQISELLELVSGVAEGGGDGRRVSRRLAGLLLSDEEAPVEYPALAVIGPLGDGLAVFVHGAAVVELETPTGVERLDGTQTVTWVDRRVPGPVGAVRALIAGATGAPDGWSQLGTGIVRASGFLWSTPQNRALSGPPATAERPLAEPAPWRPEPAPDAAPRRAAEPVPAGSDLLTAVDTQPARPQPTVPRDAASAGAHAGLAGTPAAGLAAQPAPDVEVEHVNGVDREPVRRLTLLRTPEPSDVLTGCLCENGHFTAATDDRCRECDVEMPQPATATVTRRRPVLGILAVDGGPRLPIDGPYVVGRDPGADDDVDAGRAKPLRLTDIDGRIAPVHARIEPRDWDITVIDLGTPGGTHYCPADSTDWNRVMPRVPTAIALGSKVLFGRTGVRIEPLAP